MPRVGQTVRAKSDAFLGDEYKEGEIGIVDGTNGGGIYIARMGGPRIKARSGRDLICDPQNWEVI
jgi:hypothetical protein